MKITYKFDNGDVVVVEGDEALVKWILASRRREASDNRNARRHCVSLDAVNDKSSWTASNQDNPEYRMEELLRKMGLTESREEKAERLRRAMKHLTPKQYELMHAIFYDNKTVKEFARENGLDISMIRKRYKRAVKRIQKYF